MAIDVQPAVSPHLVVDDAAAADAPAPSIRDRVLAGLRR